jgi:pyruvate formate lyase activating enzyme
METGVVTNIQKYCIHDGPGIRTTVFMKGCPLRCWWCHNPEGLSQQSEIVFFEGRCIKCGICREVCQARTANQTKEGSEQNRDYCILCGRCVSACPTGARQMVGTRMTSAEVVTEILKDRIFYDDSGGGVTFSGGEPLAQPGFLKELLEQCQARGIHTAVDTCGYAPRVHLLAIAPMTNLFLYDLKIMDDVKHRQYTSISNTTILENVVALGAVHDNIWIRVPIIPGINDDDENLDALAQFAASIGGVRQVNLLPYHKTGIAKFKRLGQKYRLEDIYEPVPEQIERFRQKLCIYGLTAKIGG